MVKKANRNIRHAEILTGLRDVTSMTKEEAPLEALIYAELATFEQPLALCHVTDQQMLRGKAQKNPFARPSTRFPPRTSRLDSTSYCKNVEA